MFRVIVLGGVGLLATDACGGETTPPVDAGADMSVAPDAFPSELPISFDAGSVDVNAQDTGGSPDAMDANDDSTPDGFPTELPH